MLKNSIERINQLYINEKYDGNSDKQIFYLYECYMLYFELGIRNMKIVNIYILFEYVSRCNNKPL